MAPFLLSLLLVSTFLGTDAAIFTVQNKCNVPVWPAISVVSTGGGLESMIGDNIKLNQDQKVSFTVQEGSLDVYARTECYADEFGRLTCATGEPSTVASFEQDEHDPALFHYHISLWGGFNVPVSIEPSGGYSGDCRPLRCGGGQELNPGEDSLTVTCTGANYLISFC